MNVWACAALVVDAGQGGEDGVEQLGRPPVAKRRERVEVAEPLVRGLVETRRQPLDERLVRSIFRRADEQIL